MDFNEISNQRLTSVVFHPFRPENMLAVYIALKPLYLFPSGLPQISDMLLMIYAAYIVIIRLSGRLEFPYDTISTVNSLTVLVFYQGFINFIWTVALTENLLRVTIFYVFNVIAFSICLMLTNFASIDELKTGIISGCVLSCAISLCGLYYRGYTVRGTSFFNNPNQLGYHAILLISLTLLCRDCSNFFKTAFIIVGSLWLVISCASKAALFGVFGLLIIFLVFGSGKKDIRSMLLQVAGIVLVFSVIYIILFSSSSSVSNNRQIDFIRYRIFNMQQEEDSDLVSGRGYDRVNEMGGNFFWGMGEGSYYRFSSMTGSEAHSTYASFFVSYGLIGILLLLRFFWRVIYAGNSIQIIRNISIASGILLYGLSHNGIRNTLVWIFLSMMVLINIENEFSAEEWEEEKL